ncbi:MAG: tetratricopeptide repeat protein [Elusimicrobiota bacterium]
MDPIHPASPGLAAPRPLRALALAGLLAAACAHVPPLIPSRDVLTPEEHVRLGASYEAQGLREEASVQYEAAVRLEPACADCWVALGNFAFVNGRLASAEAAFRKAVKAVPHHAGAENNLATAILARNGSLDEAETLARDALRQGGPLKPYILDTLANVYLRQGRFPEAEASVEQAETAAASSDRSVREQLRATHDGIKAASASHD